MRVRQRLVTDFVFLEPAQAHVERYRNSPVMHRSVPDQYKPVIFKDGVRKPFPRATKKVKAPTAGFY